MKITYISASIIPSEKANSVNVLKMSNAFAQQDHKVTLIGTQGEKDSKDIFRGYHIENIFDVKLSKSGKLSAVYRLLLGAKYSRNADIIYTRWIAAAAFLIIFTNKQLIYEYHAPQSKGLSQVFESIVVKSKKVKRHVFITKALKDFFVNKYNVLENKDLKVLPDGADSVQNLNLKESKNIFDCIYVGSFQVGKGVDLVIEIANKMPKIKFAIVGGSKNEVEEKQKKAIHENISWYGHLPHSQTNEVLQKAKIALLPNQPKVLIGNQDIGKWTSPMKLFEYMANGKAILASDIDVLKEILNHEENCILVKYDDPEAWRESIERLLANKKLLERISSNGYQQLNEKYTWKSRAKQALEGIK
ncbi:glycosyltransferase family 4 protein [Oceanobacillus kimchii]|uniref:glycosyltransferase family 4 protein n=1 Tax=Oceanobacillus kimchii TaxID=746691 RepID=UPI0021A56B1B|nr:glycosyltransferase family 4 protein [Oceanobacillus kimchii]MCT1578432.1 glycosyltransferase family 4 protein [Oceanobacillus kimchii]MCT2134610.1 glycosyltransferase family 4 protein [Oceanobacillus kimchii]